MSERPVPYFTDRRYDRLAELKEAIDREWETGRLHYPEKYPQIAKLRKDYDTLYAEVHALDPFDQIVDNANRRETLMARVERFLERSPEHRKLLKADTKNGRAIELEKNAPVRKTILKAMQADEEPDDPNDDD